MSETQDFFQCLVCNIFFGSLWKVEKHIKLHQNEDNNLPENGGGRRRGMLPIKKVTFFSCFVPVVRNQIDPAFLEQYSEVVSKEESTKARGLKNSSVNESLIVPTGERRLRKCRIQAALNIQRATAILKIPDQSEVTAEQQEDLERIQDILEEIPDSEDDDEFQPPTYVSNQYTNIRRKQGRPLGSKGKKKNIVPLIKSAGILKKRGRPPGKVKVKNDVNTCEYCSKLFPYRNDLLSHMYENHQEEAQMITCPLSSCGRPCMNLSALRTHLKVHSDAERKEFTLMEETKTSLSNAESSGEDYIPEDDKEVSNILCKFCLKKCSSLSRLKAHYKRDHADVTSILKCTLCDKYNSTDGVVGFIGHVKATHPERIDPFDERRRDRDEVRSKEKKFKCDKENCNEAFAFRFQLRNHIKRHDHFDKKKLAAENDPARRFRCPVCDKRFKFKDNLRRHFTLHLENNPYVCEFPGCNKKFNSDYNLRRHRDLHFEDYRETVRIQCPLCEATFTRKDKLPHHLRTHHKPDDIADANVKSKVYQKRLPHCTRLPLFRTYKDLQDVINAAKSTSDLTEPEPTEGSTNAVKTELPDFTPVEEVHLVDKIILAADGTAMHIKGEQLSPEKVSSSLQLNNNSQSDDPEPEAPLSEMTPLSKLITSDPLFKKLSKENPDKVKDIVATHYNFIGQRSFNCPLCNATFNRSWTLHLHLKTIHKQNYMNQKQGNLEGSEAGGVDKNNITLMCGTCGYPAKNGKDLENHITTYHNKVQCRICGIFCKSDRKLKEHINVIHKGVRNFKCKFCSLAFTSKSYVVNHEKKVHENSVKAPRKQCPFENCGRMLAPSSYKKHVDKHNGVTDPKEDKSKHKCMLCGDVLSCAPALRRHIDAIHLGKPVNRHQKKRPRPGVIRRGPKTPGDEWFQPLLQNTSGGVSTKETGHDDVTAQDPTDASITNETIPDNKVEEEETFGSILGF